MVECACGSFEHAVELAWCTRARYQMQHRHDGEEGADSLGCLY